MRARVSRSGRPSNQSGGWHPFRGTTTRRRRATPHGASPQRDREDESLKDKSPDRHLPIHDYQRLTVPQVKSRLSDLSGKQLRQVQSYEQKHKGRKTLLRAIEQRLAA